MATVTSTAVANNVMPQIHAGLNTQTVKYITSTTISAGDVIQMVRIPAGAEVTQVALLTPALGTYHIVVGDGNDDNRFILSATTSATALMLGYPFGASAAILTGIGYEYTANDTIDITIGTATTATTTGTFTMTVQYYMVGDPSR